MGVLRVSGRVYGLRLVTHTGPMNFKLTLNFKFYTAMSMWPKLTLKSPWGRIVLAPPQPEYDTDVAALRSDADALRYLPSMPKSVTAEEWRTKREAQATDDEIWSFYIHLAGPAPAFVGQCALWRIDLPNRAAEIGICVSPRVHRRGIATEALYVVLSHAFEHPDLRLHRVQFVTGATNVQMRGWLEGFGIAVEHRLREAWSDGRGGWLDNVGYSILEGEWPALKTTLEARLAARLQSGSVE